MIMRTKFFDDMADDYVKGDDGLRMIITLGIMMLLMMCRVITIQWEIIFRMMVRMLRI